MNIKSRIDRALSKHGDEVKIHIFGDIHTVRAFIRPLMYKNKMYADNSYSSLGELDESCFLYIGPYFPGMELFSSYIVCNGTRYSVAKLSKIVYRDDVIFARCILRYFIQGGVTSDKPVL
ncbi:MAG: hypothetical protein PUB05_04225 [Firmicutes bacterium]|nr:hypothetical protein [Bacillota bacterium]